MKQNRILMILFGVIQMAFTKDTDLKGPPFLKTDRLEQHRSVAAGRDIKFTCPISGYPEPIFEWSKDNEAIPEEGWERYRIQGHILKIKQVTPKDQGSFSCSGINGFGTAIFVFHLNVEVPLGSIHKSSSGNEPILEQVYPSSGSIITKSSGQSVMFKCQASGYPHPDISWYKNGRHLTEAKSDDGAAAAGFTFHLSHLSPSHAGNYTCVAVNRQGAATANWTLRVKGRPSGIVGAGVSPLNSSNVVVSSGEEAVLQCRGFWTMGVAPKVMWLRRIQTRRLSTVPANETFRYNGSHYQVLQSSELIVSEDGKFLTKLRIMRAHVEDSGVYVCTLNGLNFRQTSLTVIDNDPLMLVLCLSAGIIILVVVVIAITMRKRRSKPCPPPPGPSERALLPPSGAITRTKLHNASSVVQPRYVIHPPIPSSHTTSGHSVAPEGSVVQFPSNIMSSKVSQLSQQQGQGQPIIIYQDPTSAGSVYVASRPSITTVSHPEFQYQHLDVV